jgi:hypothetical protein
MSALPPNADIAKRGWDVRFVPKADMGWRRERVSKPPVSPFRPVAALMSPNRPLPSCGPPDNGLRFAEGCHGISSETGRRLIGRTMRKIDLRAVTAVNSDSVEFEEYRRLYGEPSLPDEPVAPVLGYNGGRARLRGRIRSAVSHVIDVRSKLEIVRDDLRERAQTLGHDSR